jgi:hypothetical protein
LQIRFFRQIPSAHRRKSNDRALWPDAPQLLDRPQAPNVILLDVDNHSVDVATMEKRFRIADFRAMNDAEFFRI